MTRSHSARHPTSWRGTRYIATLLILALGAVALSLTSTKQASAQPQVTPDLHVTVGENGFVLQWTMSNDTPADWTLNTFGILRTVGNEPTYILGPLLPGTDRSYTDVLDAETKDKWQNGTDITYRLYANFVRDVNGRSESSATSSDDVTVKGATLISQVQQGYAPLHLSAIAHSNGVNLTWNYDESAMTPSGWRLMGFGIGRWMPGDVAGAVFIQDDTSWEGPTQRDFKDHMSGVVDEMRMPGFQWNYGVFAYFDRLASGTESVRIMSKAAVTVFEAPKLPSVTNAQVIGHSDPEAVVRDAEVKWDAPHLTWDASLGFNFTPWYTVYTNNANVQFATTGSTSVSFSTINTCWYGWWIRVTIGLFFSDLVQAENNRTGVCGP